jgi:hypothetical protein
MSGFFDFIKKPGSDATQDPAQAIPQAPAASQPPATATPSTPPAAQTPHMESIQMLLQNNQGQTTPPAAQAHTLPKLQINLKRKNQLIRATHMR